MPKHKLPAVAPRVRHRLHRRAHGPRRRFGASWELESFISAVGNSKEYGRELLMGIAADKEFWDLCAEAHRLSQAREEVMDKIERHRKKMAKRFEAIGKRKTKGE